MEYSFFQSVEKLLKPIRSRISTIIQRGIIHSKGDTGFQVSLGEGDTQENIILFQHFGLSSHPPASTDCMILFPNGVRNIGFAISTQDQKGCPVELTAGESALYNQEGSYFALKKGGKIEIKNQENDLLTVLYELAEKVDSMSPYLVQTGSSPSGPCDFIRPQVDLSSVKKKLNSFRN